MARLIALTPILHDGKMCNEGDGFEVTDKAQIAQLVDCGLAVVKGQKPKSDAAAEAAEAAAKAAAEADALAASEAAATAAAAEAAKGT